MYDYFEILHEISQWEKELARLQNEDPQDSQQITEVKATINKYKTILAEEKTE